MASGQSCIEGIRREATGSETALTSLLPTVLKGTTTFTSLEAFDNQTDPLTSVFCQICEGNHEPSTPSLAN